MYVVYGRIERAGFVFICSFSVGEKLKRFKVPLVFVP